MLLYFLKILDFKTMETMLCDLFGWLCIIIMMQKEDRGSLSHSFSQKVFIEDQLCVRLCSGMRI